MHPIVEDKDFFSTAESVQQKVEKTNPLVTEEDGSADLSHNQEIVPSDAKSKKIQK